jgi:hypothetical protein
MGAVVCPRSRVVVFVRDMPAIALLIWLAWLTGKGWPFWPLVLASAFVTLELVVPLPEFLLATRRLGIHRGRDFIDVAGGYNFINGIYTTATLVLVGVAFMISFLIAKTNRARITGNAPNESTDPTP